MTCSSSLLQDENAITVDAEEPIKFNTTVEVQCKDNYFGNSTNYTCVQPEVSKPGTLEPTDGASRIDCKPGKVQKLIHLNDALHVVKTFLMNEINLRKRLIHCMKLD